MLEVSRALSDLKRNKGWRPKRSILFLSWGAEEYGLIGSTEWVEVIKALILSLIDAQMYEHIIGIQQKTIAKCNRLFEYGYCSARYD
jgi:hypothetical protein